MKVVGPNTASLGATSSSGAPDVDRGDPSLRRDLERLAALIEQASHGIVITDAQGRILWANRYSETYGGMAPGGLVGGDFLDLIHPDDLPKIWQTPEMLSIGTAGTSASYRARMKRSVDQWTWTEFTTTNLTGTPAIAGYVTNFRDVSQRTLWEAKRQAVTDLALSALADSPLSSLADETGRVARELLGASSFSLLERPDPQTHDLVLRAGGPSSSSEPGETIPTPPGSPNGRVLSAGVPVVVEDYQRLGAFPGKEAVTLSGVRSSLGVLVAGHGPAWGLLVVESDQPDGFNAADAGFLQRIAKILGLAIDRSRDTLDNSFPALRDPLTGLANQALLLERIDSGLAALRRSPQSNLVVQFLDIDGFRRINETLGHNLGDTLLCQIADRLNTVVREEDTVARFGGDEFVIVAFKRGNRSRNVASASRVLDAIRKAFTIDGYTVLISASAGLALSDTGDQSAESLLRDANAAMNRAKADGGDRYAVFDGEIHTQLIDRLDLEEELRAALANDEFKVFYQPVVDSSVELTIGFEALVRWQHPTRGFLVPGQFLSLAEDAGLISAIGQQVLLRACQQAVSWQRQLDRPDLRMSVNLAPQQLLDPHTIDAVESAISVSGIAARNLELEITETMIVEDLAKASSTIRALADLGVSIVIDDFGTGYTSLSYLKELPVSCIKIDRSFVAEVTDGAVGSAVVAAVAELATRMGVEVVAEGVENDVQLEAVRTLGINLVQGYCYAPALSDSEVDTWLAGVRGSDFSWSGRVPIDPNEL